MRVTYKSGGMVTDKIGTITGERRRRNGMPEYYVVWDNGGEGWYLSSNLKF